MLRQSLENGETVALTVSSNSMSPLFWQGDEVILAKAEAEKLVMGDIVTVVEQVGFLTHRYWGQTEEGLLLTKGDRSLLLDKPWQTAVLVGRVVARKRGTKTIWLDKGKGRWLVTVLGKITAVEQRLFDKHDANKSWVKLARRPFLGIKWLLTLITR